MKKLLYIATLVSILGSQQIHATALKFRISPAERRSAINNPKSYLHISKSKDPRNSFISAIEEHGKWADEILVNLEGDDQTVTFSHNTGTRTGDGMLLLQKLGRVRQIQSPAFYQTLEDVFNAKNLYPIQNSFVTITMPDTSDIDFQVDPLGCERWTDNLYNHIMRFYAESTPVVHDAYYGKDGDLPGPTHQGSSI
jgi:hypothetical protein